jgi:hypothetical protein
MEKVYNKGQKPKTWAGVKTFDDCVIKEEKKILSELEERIKKEKIQLCPELGKEGNFFYFCKKDYVPRDGDKKPSPMSQIYQRKVDSAFFQLNCLGRCEVCCYYNGKLKM